MPQPLRMPDKGRVIEALLQQVRADLAAVMAVTALARDEATSGETKAENKYDTRATEAAYLAAGQGERLAALRDLAARLEAGNGGRLVWVRRGGGAVGGYLLAADGGGRRVDVDGVTVTMVTPSSPVGELLDDAEAGDEVELGAAAGVVVAVT